MYFRRMKYILFIYILLLASCASAEEVPTTVPTLAPVATPIPITLTLGNCAFVEATQNLPDLTTQVDKAIKELQSDASGRAEAYGENCVYAGSGQSVFTAKETDFYLTANVKNIKDNNELGKLVISAMKIIDTLPPNSISGPQAGFVEFIFNANDGRTILRVPINKYKSLPANTSPANIIKTLFPSP